MKEKRRKQVEENKRMQQEKIAAEKGINLSEDVAKNMVDEVWNTSSLPKDILVTPRSKSGTVRIASVPDFFVKSVVDDITKKPTGKMMGGKNLSDLTGVGQEIIKKLLGKTKNPINTIVEGTIALSKQVRFNQYLDCIYCLSEFVNLKILNTTY